jgi:uncharacterized membrane protein YbhN (UPF0104 family)
MGSPSRPEKLWKGLKGLTERRWLRLGVQAMVLLSCAIYLAANLRGVQNLLTDLQVDYLLLVAAWGLTVIAVFIGAVGWWFTVRGLGQAASAGLTIRAHVLSNLAKYVPGYIWQYMGKAYLSKQAGIPLTASGPGMVLELLQLVWVGLAIAAALMPIDTARDWTGWQLPAGCMHLVGLFLFLGLLLFVLLLPWTLRKVLRDQQIVQVQRLALLAAIAAMLASWLVFGFSFWMLGAALQPLSASDIPLFVFTLVASFLIGLAVIIVPSGIGIREGMMVLILGSRMPGALAVLLAGLSRAVLFLSELTGVLILKVILRWAGLKSSESGVEDTLDELRTQE